MAEDLSSYSDAELVKKTQAESLEAFEVLVHRHERRVYAFARQLCKNSEDAAEITQDSFVKAFRALDRYDPRHAFAAWLFTIARRTCVDRFRAAPPQEELYAPEISPPADPSVELARREDLENLWGLAKQRLPSSQFQALWLRYAEDFGVRQIALVLGKTQPHVKVLLFRARHALVRELEGRIESRGRSAEKAGPGAERTSESRPQTPADRAQRATELSQQPFIPFSHHHEILVRKI